MKIGVHTVDAEQGRRVVSWTDLLVLAAAGADVVQVVGLLEPAVRVIRAAVACGTLGLGACKQRLAALGLWRELPGRRNVRRQSERERVCINRQCIQVGGPAGQLLVQFGLRGVAIALSLSASARARSRLASGPFASSQARLLQTCTSKSRRWGSSG